MDDEHDKLINDLYQRLISALEKVKDYELIGVAEGLSMVSAAFKVAKKAHSGMYRKSGEPYIIHPLEVSIICVESMGLGYFSVTCALLHDVVEDCPDFPISHIRENFGEHVAEVIEGLTKVKSIVLENYGSDNKAMIEKAETMINLLRYTVKDVRVLLIKLADRLHNMRTLDGMRYDKQVRIASETQTFYAPMAHRLGMNAIKQELDDLSFKYTGREYYTSIVKQLSEEKEKRADLLQEFISPLLNVLSENGVKAEAIIKDKPIYTIYNDMKRRKLMLVSSISELMSLRIVLDVPSGGIEENVACWKAYALITSLYEPKPGETTDWISAARSNGYKAIHTTVMSKYGKWIEVQIMSSWMNDVAERGFAAYYTEKKVSKDAVNVNNWLKRLNEILFDNDGEINYSEAFSDVKGFLYDTDIFVYADDGERRILPKGATVLDFAFAMGADIGLRCSAAFVNMNLRPKSYQLKQGEQIRIIDSENVVVDDSWLPMVITTRAKRIIKSRLIEDRKIEVGRGREQFVSYSSQLSINSNDLLTLILSAWYGDGTEDDLYYDLAIGRRTVDDINELIKRSNSTFFGRLNPLRLIRSAESGNKSLRDGKSEMSHDASLQPVLAECCHPIPGDNVVAIEDGGNVIYHRSNCHNAIDYYAMSGKGMVKERLSSSIFGRAKAVIELVAPDRSKLLGDILEVIYSKENVSLDEFNIKTIDGLAQADITLFVPNVHVLDELVKSLEDISGKIKVYRKIDN